MSIITGTTLAEWQHLVGLLLFIPLMFLFYKNWKKSVPFFGIYLLIATFNGLAFTPTISTSWINIGPIHTPPVQLLSLFIFIIYFGVNFSTLVEMYLDYQDRKRERHFKDTSF